MAGGGRPPTALLRTTTKVVGGRAKPGHDTWVTLSAGWYYIQTVTHRELLLGEVQVRADRANIDVIVCRGNRCSSGVGQFL